MSDKTGKFNIRFAGNDAVKTVEEDRIFIGRYAENCDIVLAHKTVSRIHAGINYRGKDYEIINLSEKNVLTLNGRRLPAQKTDVLADGDTIQIGPFTILVALQNGVMSVTVQGQVAERLPEKPVEPKPVAKKAVDMGDVLKAFWDKRTREKEDWGTRLRPTEKPKPGKAMFNWKPTRDLKRQWRFGLFVWAFLVIGALGAFAYFRHPESYAPKPLSNPHAAQIDNSAVAVSANANSCTTCHTLNEPLENSCITCHSATEFHSSNTKAHEQAGITCTMCHQEHRGADFDMKATAIQTCAECHNDQNKKTYNGKSVRTAHGGSYGYPMVDGAWKWKGVYREVADAIPEINRSATGDKDERAKLSRQFHTVHLYRMTAPEGITGDKRGLVTCSSCHETFGPNNVDRTTPKQTCAVCHSTPADVAGRDSRFGSSSSANCISCHVQHPYSSGRWSEFMTEDALNRRKESVAGKISQLKGQ
ncbi:MAG: FHA domain-containing protein [Pyrinomonadaceae bacterium]